MKVSNWWKALIAVLVLMWLFIFPPTRQMILFILPLGSGIDDLIFFVLLFVALILVLLKIINIKEILQKVGRWLSK